MTREDGYPLEDRPARWVLVAAFLALAAVVLLIALKIPGCAPRASHETPLVLLSTRPADGGALRLGEKVSLTFNLPVDEQSLASRVRLEPPLDLELECQGAEVTVALLGPSPGRTYALTIASGARTEEGGRLQQDVVLWFAVLPAAAGGGPEPPSEPGTSAEPSGGPSFKGALLFLEQDAVFACDLPGGYETPRFDRARLYLGASPVPAGSRPVLAEVKENGELRVVSASVAEVPGEPGVLDLAVDEETRPAASYTCGWVSAAGGTVDWVYTWAVRGMPWTYVWSLDLDSGEVSPVGRLDLGFEADELLGWPGGPLLAVGSPGGAAWYELQAVVPLSRSLSPAGQPLAVFREANFLARQGSPTCGVLLAAGPASGPPPLVGAPGWRTDGAGQPAGEGEDEAGACALFALGPDGVIPLLDGADVQARFLCGPSLADDGHRLAFATYDFGPVVLARLWRLDLPAQWETGHGQGALFPRELARVVYPVEVISAFTYAGGAAWCPGNGEVWWDVSLADNVAEVWRVEAAGGWRELLSSAAAMPLFSPDGRLCLCRTASGGTVLDRAGTEIRTVGPFLGAVWLPDSSAVLLSGPDGITLLSEGGSMRRLVSFPARSGCFVGAREFWFVSDRRL